MDPSGAYPRFVAYTEPPGPQASTSTSAAATGRGAGPVRRLPKEGVAIMEHYYNTVSTNPPESARVELAEAIRRVGPRCAFYTPQKVYQWFVNARTKARKASAAGGSVAAKLDVLLGDVPSPSLEVAEIWAEKLGAKMSAQDIVSYAQAKQVQAQGEAATAAGEASGHPTPTNSVPSTPAEAHQAPPTPALHVPPSSDSGSQPPSPIFDGGTRTPTEDSRTSVPPDEADPDDGAAAHILGAAAHIPVGAALADAPVREPPRSLAGLAEWLQGEREASAALLERISSGAYANLGLVLPRPPGAGAGGREV